MWRKGEKNAFNMGKSTWFLIDKFPLWEYNLVGKGVFKKLLR